MDTIQNITLKLTEHNIKPSLQRIKIYEYISKNLIHPAVDTIYEELIKEIPTLSKTTVYNTLKLFEKQNLIRSVNIDETEIRYDARKDTHGHFICTECGKIFDFNYNYNKIKINGLKEFEITQQNFNIKGICPECKNNKK
ncbi:MAG: transcriptional repressor [Chlorobi bacterium]|nr:transcriptional repressor [Chlorobiota bacterium]